MKWYQKVLIAVGLIVFSPLIIISLGAAGLSYLLDGPKCKKMYAQSAYFRDLAVPYKRYLFGSPEYRFYNGAKKRQLPMTYVRQPSNGLEYVVFEGVVYVFPEFEQIDFDKEKSIWEVNYDGDWTPFDEVYRNQIAQMEEKVDASCIKLLVERAMFVARDLSETGIPDEIFVTWNYETAFEHEDSPSKLRVPETTEELLDMMNQAPDLGGEYYMGENGNIVWDLFDSIRIEIGVEYLGIDEILPNGGTREITHWHPTAEDVYNDICKVGKRGKILVIRTSLLSADLLYVGDKEECPYRKDQKRLFGKQYFLEVE